VRLLSLVVLFLQRFPVFLPLIVRVYAQPLIYAAAVAAGYLEGASSTLSKYALVYVGITGDPFWPSARRARALAVAAESSGGKYKRRFQTEREPLELFSCCPDR